MGALDPGDQHAHTPPRTASHTSASMPSTSRKNLRLDACASPNAFRAASLTFVTKRVAAPSPQSATLPRAPAAPRQPTNALGSSSPAVRSPSSTQRSRPLSTRTRTRGARIRATCPRCARQRDVDRAHSASRRSSKAQRVTLPTTNTSSTSRTRSCTTPSEPRPHCDPLPPRVVPGSSPITLLPSPTPRAVDGTGAGAAGGGGAAAEKTSWLNRRSPPPPRADSLRPSGRARSGFATGPATRPPEPPYSTSTVIT